MTSDEPRLMERTDNRYLPNTKAGWDKFLWKLHFCNAQSILIANHYINLEKRWRKENASNQDS